MLPGTIARTAHWLLLLSLALATGCDDADDAHNAHDADADADAAPHDSGAPPTADPQADDGDPEAPGELVHDPSATGRASCAGITVASLLDTIHAAHPDLADIVMIYSATPRAGDGSFVLPYLRDDGGFAFVFVRGTGDCPAGCIEREYWYFATDQACALQQVGHYRPRFSPSEPPCIVQQGRPMFGQPPTPDPIEVCGTDKAPQDLAGTYAFKATGERNLCATATSGQEKTVDTLDDEISIELVQDQDDPSRGTATVSGTGYPLLDGRPIAATFTRQRFLANETFDNVPAICQASHMFHVGYDFEGFGERVVYVEEVATPNCKGAPDDYCKGGMSLALELIE